MSAPALKTGMATFAHAHAAGEAWRQTLAACRDTLAAQNAKGAVGLICVTEVWATHLGDMAATLQQRLTVHHWTGCAGFGIFAAGPEYQRKPAMSVLVDPSASTKYMCRAWRVRRRCSGLSAARRV